MKRYEQRIIRPILNLIEKNQEYLTRPENLPQLAKLGFLFEHFWYAGRVAFGYDGIVAKSNQCENNPKYELGDTIEYVNEDIENLIYDAWGMHIDEETKTLSWEDFEKLVLVGKPLTEYDLKLRKPNKTFDEWVEVLTDKRFRYHSIYPDRRSVANHLLCSFGNGYGYNKKTGMVFSEASGADQDVDSYGDWENCVFLPKIRKVVERVMGIPEAKMAIESRAEAILKWKKQREEDKKKENTVSGVDLNALYEILLPKVNGWLEECGRDKVKKDDPNIRELCLDYMDATSIKLKKDKDVKYVEPQYDYYPWCHYSIITMIDENSHPSYMKAALEICLYTMRNPPIPRKDANKFELKGIKERVKFASDFVVKYMGDTAIDDDPKVLPKHSYGHK